MTNSSEVDLGVASARIDFFKARMRSGSDPVDAAIQLAAELEGVLTEHSCNLLVDLVLDLLREKEPDAACVIISVTERFQKTTDLATLEMFAMASWTGGYPDDAIGFYERYLDAGGKIETILFDLSHCFIQSGDVETARELLSIHGRTNSLSSSFLGLAEIAKIEGNLEEALAFLLKAHSMGVSDVPPGWMCLQIAGVYLDLKFVSEALRWVDKALLEGETGESLLLKANILLRANQLAEAEQHCLRALKMAPSLQGRRVLFQILRRINLDQAKSCLTESIRICGSSVPAELIKDSGILLMDQKNWLGAVDSLRQACELFTEIVLKRSIFGASRRSLPVLPASKAATALADFAAFCSENRIPYFLSFGTALGVIREGKLLGHDKDLDVGIFPTGDIKVLADLADQSPKFLVDRLYDDMFDCDVSDLKLFAPIRHIETGITLDVCQFFERDGKFYAGFHNALDTEFLWEFEPFELQEVDCLGGKYAVPSPSDRYLESLYGNWEIPDKNFDSVVEAPNLTAKSETIRLCYCLTRYCEAYSAGDWLRFMKYAAKLSQIESFNSWASAALSHVTLHTSGNTQPN